MCLHLFNECHDATVGSFSNNATLNTFHLLYNRFSWTTFGYYCYRTRYSSRVVFCLFFLIYLLTFCFYLCICVFVFVCVCHMYMGACGDQKRVSGARVIGSCDCLYGCWEFNLGSLERNKHHSFPCINKPDTAYLEWCCCEFLFGWLVGLVCFFWGGG